MKLAIVLPSWIGDVVMATPTLRALRNHFDSGTTITGIMRPYVAKVLAGTPWLDRTIYHDRRSRAPDLRPGRLIRRLREENYDWTILMSNSFRTGMIAWLGGSSRRLGYVRYGRGMLLTDKLYPLRSQGKLVPVSAVDYYLDLAYYMGCPPEARRLELNVSSDDACAANVIWEDLGLDQSEKVIVLNTGGAFGTAKHWPSEYYVDLARRITQDERHAVLVICGPAERENAAAIEDQVRHPRVRSMARQNLDLGITKACIQKADAMVTTDSGPRHIATAMNVPVVSLFGPIDPRWTETYHPKSINHFRHLSCSPCGKRHCPVEHHRCMRDLSVDEIYRSVLRLVEEKVPQPVKVAA